MKKSFIALALLASGLFVSVLAQTKGIRAGTPIPDRYIVVYKTSVDDASGITTELLKGRSAFVKNHFGRAIKGFSAQMSVAEAKRLAADPRVAFVEQDMVLTTQATQSSPTWGLDRIDQVDLPLNSVYNYSYTGQGVRAYIVDTGIRADHVEYASRVLSGYTVIADGNGTNDCNGHGTHVAGTVGGITYGVAKSVSLVPVRVLDCNGSGSVSGIVAGLDWVASQAQAPAVVNMSLGGGASLSLDNAVANLVSKGISVVVAAGNSNADACNYSPARARGAITVGATSPTDARASFSNYGSCLDVFAPGQGITSSYHTGSTALASLSGTSMAAPHVAGVVALALQAKPTATPADIETFIKSNASSNKVTSAGTGSPNLLLYSLGGFTTSPPTSTPKVAVASLQGSASVGRRDWTATATVQAFNPDTKTALSGVTVTLSFNPGAVVSCKTGSTGRCSVKASRIPLSVTSTKARVENMVLSTYSYDASRNIISEVLISR